jgi:hypothetical protein
MAVVGAKYRRRVREQKDAASAAGDQYRNEGRAEQERDPQNPQMALPDPIMRALNRSGMLALLRHTETAAREQPPAQERSASSQGDR